MAKYAIMINADTDQNHVGACANGLEYALDLDDNGHDAEVYFDGAATKWIPKLDKTSDHPVLKYWEEARERGLIAGACGFCSQSYGVADEVEAAGIDRIGGNDHGPHMGDLVDAGYEIITVG